MGAQTHPARAVSLGASGAEVITDVPFALFAAVQVLLPWGDGTLATLDAKIVRAAASRGGPAVVRFTGLDWDPRERLDELATARLTRDALAGGQAARQA